MWSFLDVIFVTICCPLWLFHFLCESLKHLLKCFVVKQEEWMVSQWLALACIVYISFLCEWKKCFKCLENLPIWKNCLWKKFERLRLCFSEFVRISKLQNSNTLLIDILIIHVETSTAFHNWKTTFWKKWLWRSTGWLRSIKSLKKWYTCFIVHYLMTLLYCMKAYMMLT